MCKVCVFLYNTYITFRIFIFIIYCDWKNLTCVLLLCNDICLFYLYYLQTLSLTLLGCLMIQDQIYYQKISWKIQVRLHNHLINHLMYNYLFHLIVHVSVYLHHNQHQLMFYFNTVTQFSISYGIHLTDLNVHLIHFQIQHILSHLSSLQLDLMA